MKTPTAPPIDLPGPPFETAVAEGPLNDAPIIAHLLNGSTLHGNLRHLNISGEIAAIQETSRNEVIEIPFARFQHIAFTRELTISSEEHPLEPRTRGIESPDVQMFRVTFKDDKSVTGKTCSSIVNQAGLHFFTPINEYSVARMFVPTTVVKHYHIAPLPDHSPARNTSIPSQEITITTSTDKSQRDKKTGEYLLEI